MSENNSQSHRKYVTPALLMRGLGLCLLYVSVIPLLYISNQALAAEPSHEELLTGEPFIYSLESEERGGKAYRLVYLVGVPIDVFWNFKTDFKGSFLLSHKYIVKHRFVRREGNVVITETEYSSNPNVAFRWETIVSPSDYRLDFTLINPEDSDQEFHYGHIQLSPLGQQTKVTHVAYFDFLGVTHWVHYPWKGGMSEFLEYTARWEQDTVLRLKEGYMRKAGKQQAPPD